MRAFIDFVVYNCAAIYWMIRASWRSACGRLFPFSGASDWFVDDVIDALEDADDEQGGDEDIRGLLRLAREERLTRDTATLRRVVATATEGDM